MEPSTISPRNSDAGPRPAPLAVVVVCLTFLLSYVAGYKAGRSDEQRTQLGKLLAYAPALEDMRAATRFADSMGTQFMIQWERLHRKR